MDFSDIKAEFKQIKGFDDYFITKDGDVYSIRPIGGSRTQRLHKMKPKDPGNDSKYLNIVLYNNVERKTFSIHRLVAEYFVDGHFDGAVVNHIDGNNRNNKATNLEWTTVADNVHKGYITSGLNQKRNMKKWKLYNPDGECVGVFNGHGAMEEYVRSNNLDASPSQLTKDGNSRGYTIVKE